MGKRRLHRCILVQDAHTPGEQVVLSTLYRLAKNPRWGRTESDGSAIVSVSLKELAEQARMHETNVRINIRSLIDKLAIELIAKEDRKQQTARRYRLFSYRQILDRRRTAGLEWVVKGRGITFVPTSMALDVLASDLLPGEYELDDRPLASEGVSPLASETLHSLPSASLALPILEKKSLGNDDRHQPTTMVDGNLVGLVRRYGLEPDDEILQRLITAAQQRSLDGTGVAATADEILYFTEQKLKALQMAHGVRNPLALLASIVPKCFEGESFRTYRQEMERERLREHEQLLKQKAELEQWRREQETILADPGSSEEEKEWARQSLGLPSSDGAGN